MKKLKEVDVVIVGLGWTGGILSKELSEAGRVALLGHVVIGHQFIIEEQGPHAAGAGELMRQVGPTSGLLQALLQQEACSRSIISPQRGLGEEREHPSYHPWSTRLVVGGFGLSEQGSRFSLLALRYGYVR